MKFTIALLAAAFAVADCSNAQMSPAVSYSSDIATQVCHACVTGVTFLNTMVDAEGEQWNQVRAAMLQQCDAAPAGPIREYCEAAVSQIDNVITPLIAGDLKPLKVCVKLGVCGQQDSTVSSALATATGESNLGSLIEKLCHKCDELSTQVKSAILQAFSQWTTIREQLVEQCKAQATPEIQAQCQQGIDALDGLVESAKQTIAKTDVCNMAGCPPESPVTSLAMLAKSEEMPAQSMSPALRGAGPMQGLCNKCEQFSAVVGARLDALVEQVVSRSDEICSKRPKPEDVEQCKAAMQQMQAFYKQLADSIKDNKFCFMCRDAPTVNFATIALTHLGKAGNSEEGGICGACAVASDSVKAQVRDFIEQYHVASKTLAAKCEECPEADVQDMCKQGLAQLDAAVEQVRAAVADSDVCSLIGCDADDVLVLVPAVELSALE